MIITDAMVETTNKTMTTTTAAATLKNKTHRGHQSRACVDKALL